MGVIEYEFAAAYLTEVSCRHRIRMQLGLFLLDPHVFMQIFLAKLIEFGYVFLHLDGLQDLFLLQQFLFLDLLHLLHLHELLDLALLHHNAPSLLRLRLFHHRVLLVPEWLSHTDLSDSLLRIVSRPHHPVAHFQLVFLGHFQLDGLQFLLDLALDIHELQSVILPVVLQFVLLLRVEERLALRILRLLQLLRLRRLLHEPLLVFTHHYHSLHPVQCLLLMVSTWFAIVLFGLVPFLARRCLFLHLAVQHAHRRS